jgi:hypothetical protein
MNALEQLAGMFLPQELSFEEELRIASRLVPRVARLADLILWLSKLAASRQPEHPSPPRVNWSIPARCWQPQTRNG